MQTEELVFSLSRVCEPVVSRDDDVDSSAGLADILALLVVHLPQRVGEWSRGVDHTLGLHVKLFSCEQDILESDQTDCPNSRRPPGGAVPHL